MSLTTQDVLKEITEIHKEIPMYGHPLWVAMVEGTWNFEQSQYVANSTEVYRFIIIIIMGTYTAFVRTRPGEK